MGIVGSGFGGKVQGDEVYSQIRSVLSQWGSICCESAPSFTQGETGIGQHQVFKSTTQEGNNAIFMILGTGVEDGGD